MDDVIMPPVYPGEILLTEFLEPLELSQYQLARSIAVTAWGASCWTAAIIFCRSAPPERKFDASCWPWARSIPTMPAMAQIPP